MSRGFDRSFLCAFAHKLCAADPVFHATGEDDYPQHNNSAQQTVSVDDFLRDEIGEAAPVEVPPSTIRLKWAFKGDPEKRQLVLPKDALVVILRYYPELGALRRVCMHVGASACVCADTPRVRLELRAFGRDRRKGVFT